MAGAGADGRTPSPSPSPRLTDPCVGRRAALGKSTARRTRTPPAWRQEVAGPSVDLLVPGEWPVLPQCHSHPSILYWEQWTSLDDGRCLRFLDDRTCGVLLARAKTAAGIRVVESPQSDGAQREEEGLRRRRRRERRRKMRRS